MPKQATSLDLALPPRDTAVPAYRWLYDALRTAILAGRLRAGAKLPSTRDLAARYGLARGTVVRAFEQLAAEGYLEGTVGAGTFVARDLPDDLLEVRRQRPAAGAERGVRAAQHGARAAGRNARAQRPPRLTAFARRLPAAPVFGGLPLRAFRTDLPAFDLFPTALWAQLAARRLRGASLRDLLAGPHLGVVPLRQAVADYLNQSRGARCTAEQVAIVSGVQEAIDLAMRLLVEPGDRVVLEEPGYIGGGQLVAAHGAVIVPAPVDAQGVRVEPRRWRGARLAYVTPAHQYPLGMAMSLPRRLELLDWARTSGARILEDDYDSEYRYAGRPLPALQGLDDGGAVLLAGSFNKVLFPSLRLGYLVLPDDLVERATAARALLVRHPPLLEQRVLADFLVEGHFARHLRRMREVYAERLGVLLDSARERLRGLLELSAIEAGLQISARLAPGLRARAAARAAAARGVEVIPLDHFCRQRPPFEGLQLGFAAVGPREIRRGVRELAAALEGELAARATRASAR